MDIHVSIDKERDKALPGRDQSYVSLLIVVVLVNNVD
jgi:hypothetical protein